VDRGQKGVTVMIAKAYKKVEIVGTSDQSISEAIKNGLERARKTIRHVDWFEVSEIRGAIYNDTVVYQVPIKIGFRLEDDGDE
jgi:flavin-binding protein dodecin